MYLANVRASVVVVECSPTGLSPENVKYTSKQDRDTIRDSSSSYYRITMLIPIR